MREGGWKRGEVRCRGGEGGALEDQKGRFGIDVAVEDGAAAGLVCAMDLRSEWLQKRVE